MRAGATCEKPSHSCACIILIDSCFCPCGLVVTFLMQRESWLHVPTDAVASSSAHLRVSEFTFAFSTKKNICARAGCTRNCEEHSTTRGFATAAYRAHNISDARTKAAGPGSLCRCPVAQTHCLVMYENIMWRG